MAKKVTKRSSSSSAGATSTLPLVDRKTRKLIVGLANEVEKAAEKHVIHIWISQLAVFQMFGLISREK